MKNFYWEFSRAHRLEVSVGVLVAVVIGVLAIVKRIAARAATWPTIIATIENVFVDVKNRGRSRTPETHAVLAYGYSVGVSLGYSGEIRLFDRRTEP